MAKAISHKNGNTTLYLSKDEREILIALLGACRADDKTTNLYGQLYTNIGYRKYYVDCQYPIVLMENQQ